MTEKNKAGQLFIVTFKRQQQRTKSKSNPIEKEYTEREKIALHATRFGLDTNIKAMEKYPRFCKIQRDMNCFHIYNMHNIH